MDKIDTLITSMQGSLIFDNYIYSIIFKNVFTSDEIITKEWNNVIKVALAKIAILNIKEEIILKPKNDLYSNNLFSSIMELAKKISVENDEHSLEINGVIFDDGNKLVASIRNKLAHADYVFSDDLEYIIFSFDGKEAPVLIDDLVDFARKLIQLKGEYKRIDDYTRSIAITTTPRKRISSCFMTDSSLSALLDYCFNYRFNLLSTKGNIPKEAYDEFDEILNTVFNSNIKYRDDIGDKHIKRVDDIIKKSTEDFNKKSIDSNWNVEMTTEKRGLKPDQKDEVIKYFKSLKKCLHFVTNITYENALVEMPYYALRKCDEDYNKDICLIQCGKLILCLMCALQSKISDIRIVAPSVSAQLNSKPIFINQDSYAIAQIIKLLDISYLFENIDFDYSLLPLDNLKPIIFNYTDHEIDELIKTIEATERKLNKQIINLSGAMDEMINSMKSDKVSNKKETLSIIKMKIEAFKERIESLKQANQINNNKLRMLMNDRLENEKHYYNKRLIERIRDSISHGNYQIIPTIDIENTIVRFEDEFNGSIDLVLEVTIKDLQLIVDGCNSSIFENLIKKRNK